ncbi:MAG: YlbF family regulator, partial [Liquorilactobacillus ghanensis]|uniref:YlbF family regulator n=1 Tax=Liquorilactobacillus ghanensis TaxID=399370 RepID=UPI0039E934FD
MINIYDTANQLEEDLRKTDEFIALKGAYARLKQDPLAFTMFKKFQKRQVEFQKKQADGSLKDSDLEELKKLGEQVEKNPAIMELMTKEHQLAKLMDEVNQICLNQLMNFIKIRIK